jgi:hypothetical protein
MKTILSENLLRFGVKNLSESQKRALTLKTILETIDAHGLRQEVRKALTEGDAPSKPNADVVIDATANTATYKESENFEPLVIQSPTSLKEASMILGNLMKLVGQGKAESTATINLIKQITSNNYPAILWKVRYGSTFKSNTGSNYNTICDWLSKSVDVPSPSGSTTDGPDVPGVGGKGPIGLTRDFFVGTKTAEAIERHLGTLNNAEYFNK